MLVGAGQGLDKRGKDLGKVLGSLGPLTKSLDQINSKVAERKEELSRLITNFNLLTKEVGRSERTITALIENSNVAVGAIAEQDPSVQRAIQLLPGTLAQSTETLNNVALFADQLGPAFGELRPFARNLDELNASTRKLAIETTPVIKDQIRPFVRSAREPVRDLSSAAAELSRATPKLTVVAKKINRLGNMAAYNPTRGRGAGNAQPRRGLPLLGRLARAQLRFRLPGPGRSRRRPPDLSDPGLRRGSGPAGSEPARSRRHGPRSAVRARRAVRGRMLRGEVS